MFVVSLFTEKKALAEKAKEEEEKRRREAEISNQEDDETTMEPNDLDETEKVPIAEEDEQQPGSKAPSPPPAEASPPPAASVPAEELQGLGPEDEQTQVEPVGPVTAEHPDVKKAVEQAVEDARNAAVTIPADVYAELMHKAIQSVEQEQREKNPNGPL